MSEVLEGARTEQFIVTSTGSQQQRLLFRGTREGNQGQNLLLKAAKFHVPGLVQSVSYISNGQLLLLVLLRDHTRGHVFSCNELHHCLVSLMKADPLG